MDSSTQSFLQIKDIKEGVVIVKNNNIRGVLMVSSINFALKSDEDRSTIIYAFQSFLNSLDFSCQIVIQSRKINITRYLDSLRDLQGKQTNELLKIQTSSYIKFIQELVSGDVVMTKSFYVVVPYNLALMSGAKNITKQIDISKLFGKKNEKNGNEDIKIKDEDFEKNKGQLWQRMEFVALRLRRCGLESVPLTTPELIELFWAIHNPDQAEIGYSPDIIPELLK